MSAADTIRDALGAGRSYAAGKITFGPKPEQFSEALAALDELEAELSRTHSQLSQCAGRLLDEEGQRKDAEAEMERLTVGRATLEDQTNRAELAEARVAALREFINNGIAVQLDDKRLSYILAQVDRHELDAARAVLSGGSE